jgi:adenosine deaminase
MTLEYIHYVYVPLYFLAPCFDCANLNENLSQGPGRVSTCRFSLWDPDSMSIFCRHKMQVWISASDQYASFQSLVGKEVKVLFRAQYPSTPIVGYKRDRDFPASNRTMKNDVVASLPKVELHAHLNGCIREITLFDLAQERGFQLNDHHFSLHPQEGTDHSMYNVRPRSLKDCFDMFAEIGQCVDDLVALRRITLEALEDFADHGVVYLELRSTPKCLLIQHGASEVATKYDYCVAVLETMNQFRKNEEERYARDLELSNIALPGTSSIPPRLPLIPTFIVSVDRSQSVECGLEHVNLASDLATKYDCVVGMDLGGNPLKSGFAEFRASFELARQLGLKITLHCGEVPIPNEINGGEVDRSSRAYKDAKAILDFHPDRLGHALLLSSDLQKQLLGAKIPVETCPTSNVMTLELNEKSSDGSLLEGMNKHPQLKSWLETSHPIVVCTDDPGVFDTSATKELILIQQALHVTIDTLKNIIVKSMDYAFCSQEIKDLVKGRIRERMFDKD